MNALTPGRAPTIERLEDGRTIALEPFPDVLEFTCEILENGDRNHLTVRDGMIEVRLANGRWVYEIVERHYETNSVVGVIRYREES